MLHLILLEKILKETSIWLPAETKEAKIRRNKTIQLSNVRRARAQASEQSCPAREGECKPARKGERKPARKGERKPARKGERKDECKGERKVERKGNCTSAMNLEQPLKVRNIYIYIYNKNMCVCVHLRRCGNNIHAALRLGPPAPT